MYFRFLLVPLHQMVTMFDIEELISNLKASFDGFDFVAETMLWQDVDLAGIDELWQSLVDCIVEENQEFIELAEIPGCPPETVFISYYRCNFIGLVDKIIKFIHYHSGLGYTISCISEGRHFVDQAYTYV